MGGIDSYTSLMLHMNGVDESPSFIDDSPNAHTVTANGNAQIDTAQSKFGGASGFFNGSGDYLSVPDSAAWDIMPNEAWTIDFWFRYPSSAADNVHTIVSHMDDPTYAGWCVYLYLDTVSEYGDISFYYADGLEIDSQEWFHFSTSVGYFPPDTWAHIALTRSGSTCKIFLNGVSVTLDSGPSESSTHPGFANTSPLRIGQGYDEVCIGWIDELRISKGIVRWTENFTPPTEEFDAIAEETIEDGLGIADSDRVFLYLPQISDSMFCWEALGFGWHAPASDSLAIADTLASKLGIAAVDWLTLNDSIVTGWVGTVGITENISLLDAARAGYHFSVSDAIQVTDSVTINLVVSVLESMGFNDLASAIGVFSRGISDSIDISDQAKAALSFIVSETLDAIDVVQLVCLYLNSISDQLNLSESVLERVRAIVSANDSMAFVDSVASNGVFYHTVYDAIHLSHTIEIDGQVYECWVLNTGKFYPSLYSGFNFNSYAMFEDRAYGANDNGIYELTGETDSGNAIHAGVELPQTRFGVPTSKRFLRAYLGVSGDSPVMMMETEDGTTKTYEINTEGIAHTTRDMKGKSWKLRVSEFQTLDFIKLFPVVLSR